MPHHIGHLITGVAALAATLAAHQPHVPTRLVRRKLRLSVLLFGSYLVLHVVLFVRPRLVAGHARRRSRDRSSSSRWRPGSSTCSSSRHQSAARRPRAGCGSRRSCRTPSSSACFAVVATFVFGDKLLTTSAVGAVIVGFALQDTLGNAFAGLAIQSEKPFRVGAWIRVGEFEGRVAEVTWRATKLRTKAGNFVVVPNNIVAKEAITNYSEPTVPTRLEVEVGASYLSTPGDVKKAILEAVANVAARPSDAAPDALLHSFDGSAITYRARFWIDNYEMDEIVARRGADGDLLRVRAARDRDPVADRSADTSASGRSRIPPPNSGSAKPFSPASICSSG